MTEPILPEPTPPAPTSMPIPAPAPAQMLASTPRATATMPAAPPANRQRNVLLAILAVVVVVFLISRLFPRENRYERLASQVTVAIVNNDMRPVVKDFNAIRRPELQDRARVGNLSNLAAPLGKFKGSKETAAPPGSPDGYHQFVERFEKGTLLEKYQLDGDGKIVKFHLGPNGQG